VKVKIQNIGKNLNKNIEKKNEGEESDNNEELEEGSGSEENASGDENEEQISGKKKVITIPLHFKPIEMSRGGPPLKPGGPPRDISIGLK